MHRFYRDRKNQDKSGLGFVVAVVVTLAAAFLIGNNLMGKDKSQLGGVGTSPVSAKTTVSGDSAGTTVQAQPFTVTLLQVGAYSTPEQANKAVQTLSDNGIMAASVQIGQFYKVIVGAYMDDAAVETVKASLQPKLDAMKMGNAFSYKMTISNAPGVLPATAGEVQPVQQGAQDINVYLQQAGNWLASYASGQMDGLDLVQATAAKLTTAAKGMQQYAQDATAGQLLTMVQDVNANLQALQQLSKSSAHTDYQKAMSGYVTLLQEFKKWTAQPGS